MAKEHKITMRAETDDLIRLKQASRMVGSMSLSAYVRQASVKQARQDIANYAVKKGVNNESTD